MSGGIFWLYEGMVSFILHIVIDETKKTILFVCRTIAVRAKNIKIL